MAEVGCAISAAKGDEMNQSQIVDKAVDDYIKDFFGDADMPNVIAETREILRPRIEEAVSQAFQLGSEDMERHINSGDS